MNVWYIAAILFGAVAGFCGYYGSVVEGRRSSEEQSSHIESQLQTLGTQIQELRLGTGSPIQSDRIKEVDDKYRELAEDFFRSIPLRTAQEQARTAKQHVEDVQRTQEVEAYLRAVEQEAEKLATAYNRFAGQLVLELESNGVPSNLFDPSQDHPAYVLMKFRGQKYWGIRITSYPDRALALQFVRLLSPDGSSDYKGMRLTNDSINLILLKDQFGVSMNQALSDAVRANIINGLPITRQPLAELQRFATEITRRIIEYELLPLKSS